jgi:hypothetical protein
MSSMLVALVADHHAWSFITPSLWTRQRRRTTTTCQSRQKWWWSCRLRLKLKQNFFADDGDEGLLLQHFF